MTQAQQKSIADCYSTYCEVIKPLIAQIEALSEKIPLPLFNEIRAFNDHIARCYYGNPAQAYIDEQIDRACRHILRLTLDCFKCLNVILYQKIELFEQQTRNIDLTVIDNGTFYPAYSRKKVEAAKIVQEAKQVEATDINLSLAKFQESFNLYTEINASIISISEKVRWARTRFTRRRWLTPVLWTVSVIISAIISAIFSCELIAHFTGQ